MDFVFNEKDKEYEAYIEVLNKKVSIYAKDDKDVEMANKIIKELDINALIDFIVKEYYDENDAAWFGSEVSKEEFINSIYLKTISFRYGFIEYWFDAGDLYCGHDILITRKYDDKKLTIDLA